MVPTVRLLALALIVGLLTVAGPTSAFAQLPDPGQWYLGISGGAPRTTLEGDFVESSEAFWGMFYGGYLEYGLASNFLVDVELNLLRSTTRAVVTSGETVTFGITQIEIPVLFEGATSLGGAVIVGAYAGGSVGFIAECTSGVGRFGPSTACDDSDLGLSTQFAEFSGIVGGGFGFNLGEKGGVLLFDARYTYGLTSLFSEDRDVRARSLILIARASIPILR